MPTLLPQIHLGLRDCLHKGRQFIGIQLTVTIPMHPRELHLEEPITSRFETVSVAAIDRTHSWIAMKTSGLEKGDLIVDKPRHRGFMETPV